MGMPCAAGVKRRLDPAPAVWHNGATFPLEETRFMRTKLFALTSFALSACSGGADQAQPMAPATATAAAPTAEATPSAPVAPKVEENAYVTGATGVRREPNEEKEIPDPKAKGKKKTRSNAFMTLYRGEEVTITGIEGEWAKVRTSDEQEGWLKMSLLVRAADVTLGTVFTETKRFRRPDLLALNTDQSVEAGTLLYVLRSKDQFSEINLGGSQTTWVLSESLSTDSREVSAAKLYNKIRSMQKANDAGASKLIELAKGQFADSKVLALLDAPAAGAEAAAAAAAPSEQAAGGEAAAPAAQ
jgi:hypothetical protein